MPRECCARDSLCVAFGDWEAFEGCAALGPLPPGITYGYVHEMSADASVLGVSATFRGRGIALLWTPERGHEVFLDMLTQRCGLDLTGWHLSEIGGISADGKTIVGTGVHNGFTEAFVAVIPGPGVLAPFVVLAWRRRRR